MQTVDPSLAPVRDMHKASHDPFRDRRWINIAYLLTYLAHRRLVPTDTRTATTWEPRNSVYRNCSSSSPHSSRFHISSPSLLSDIYPSLSLFILRLLLYPHLQGAQKGPSSIPPAATPQKPDAFHLVSSHYYQLFSFPSFSISFSYTSPRLKRKSSILLRKHSTYRTS